MASSVTVKVELNDRNLKRAVAFAPGTEAALRKHTDKIKSRANSMAAGYTTPKWHDHETGETKGGTKAAYDGDVILGRKGYVGIVYPANYAAQKENHQHNTLLKAKG